MVLLGAPMDLRMPISRVRSVTLTSMMFMMPTPAVRSAMKLMMKAPVPMVCSMERKESMSDWLVWMEKSVESRRLRPRAMRMAPMAWFNVVV